MPPPCVAAGGVTGSGERFHIKVSQPPLFMFSILLFRENAAPR